MRIGLAAYEFINKDIEFNISQIEKVLQSVQGQADLVCLGEAFLQGFDALVWNYEADQQMAITRESEIIQRLCAMTLQYGVDLLLGYIEREDERLYSSCIFIEKGRILHNYRRISKGWKVWRITDDHYQEGDTTEAFLYHGQRIQIALCGDLWEEPERFAVDGLLIWPVYVNFTIEEWKQYEREYAEQARKAAKRTLMVNSITKNPVSHGGAFYFEEGTIRQCLPYGEEKILLVIL